MKIVIVPDVLMAYPIPNRLFKVYNSIPASWKVCGSFLVPRVEFGAA